MTCKAFGIYILTNLSILTNWSVFNYVILLSFFCYRHNQMIGFIIDFVRHFVFMISMRCRIQVFRYPKPSVYPTKAASHLTMNRVISYQRSLSKKNHCLQMRYESNDCHFNFTPFLSLINVNFISTLIFVM